MTLTDTFVQGETPLPEQIADVHAYDHYVAGLCAHEDDALRLAREELGANGLPIIHVNPTEGKLLHVLARAAGARRILEIGTLGGYSAIWLARALPAGGTLLSLELDSHHADVARRNLERAGVADRVEVRVGPAADSLRALAAQGVAPFDLVFIDADKDGYPEYLELSYPLTRAGGLILADNTLSPAVLDSSTDNGITRYNKAVAAHTGLTASILPIIGRGTNGLSIAVKGTAE
jgi:predicted O-methyltransferase YrrM